MKKKINLYFSLICYVVSFILIGYYLILEFAIINLTSPVERIGIIFIIILLMYFGCFFIKKYNMEYVKKLAKINMVIWFILYIVMILNLTLFDQYFGRSSDLLYIHSQEQMNNYVTYNFNIKPFSTINNFILAFKNNNVSFSNFVYNIFGNILAFMPMAFFIPRLFKKMDKWYYFFIINSLFIIFIECMQLITMSGSCDIDDYILNMFGALLLYGIINNKFVRKYIDKWLYLEA